MVLVDFAGIAIGSVLGQLNKGEKLSENLVKHIVLNNINEKVEEMMQSDKTFSNYLKKINSKIKITTYNKDLNNENITKLIPKTTNLILDCTDNLETRFLINDYSLKNNIPWIYAAGGIQTRFQLAGSIDGRLLCRFAE